MKKWIKKLIKAIKAWANRLAADYKAWRKRCRESMQQRAEKRKQYMTKLKTKWKELVEKWRNWLTKRRNAYRAFSMRTLMFGELQKYRIETATGKYEVVARKYKIRIRRPNEGGYIVLKDGLRKVGSFTNVETVIKL